jgi:hypothetical protein
MTDSTAGGTHLLYQDFVVPASVPAATFSSSFFVNNAATAFFVPTPATLDWFGTALNQQARVDIMLPSADPFSIAPGDILQNLFSTPVGSPLVSGYTLVNADVNTVLAAHAGQTLRLRFAEVDNVNFFNFGVDQVSLILVPAPSVAAIVLFPALLRGRRRE